MSEKRIRSYEVKCLIELLSALVNQNEIPRWARQPNWGSLYKMADYHGVANVVYYGILGFDSKELEPWKKKFEERFHQAVLSEERFSAIVPQVLNVLEKNKVHSIILHEYRMRHFYPHSDMRAVKYVRIFVEKGKEESVRKSMKYLDFEEQESRIEGEIRYYKIPGILFIFQSSLDFTNKKIKKYFSLPIKDYTKEQGYRYIHGFEPEEYYVYVIGCAAESYARGNLDIQFILDMWFYYISVYKELDWTVVYKELSYLDLGSFPEYIIKLAAFWFGGMLFPEDDILFDSMERYILSKGGQCRKESEKLLPLVKEVSDFYKKDLQQKRRQQMREWVFPQMEYMSTMFPILLKHSWLLPVCWTLRILRMSGQQINLWVLQKNQDIQRAWHQFYHPKRERVRRWYKPKIDAVRNWFRTRKETFLGWCRKSSENLGSWYRQEKQNIGEWYKRRCQSIQRIKVNFKRKGIGAMNIKEYLKKFLGKK
ncbi:MAG: nucleotidyltransferase family protein [Muricomes sp.]